MNDSTSIYKLIELSFDAKKPAMMLESNWFFMGSIVFLLMLLLFFKLFFFKNFFLQEMSLEIGGKPKVSFKVQRNDENLYIANRIYMELMTRKAAIMIDENDDVIEEVYDSWYKLFCVIREEIKSLPGKYLKKHDPSAALVGLTRRILNEALRPHLTRYQAKFRKWYDYAKKQPENIMRSPQEVQRKYPFYDELISSMKEVNMILIDYANELDKLIKGGRIKSLIEVTKRRLPEFNLF